MTTAQNYQYLSEWNPLIANAFVPTVQVATCFFQQKNKFLVLQRARQDLQYTLWGIPGGKLEKNEAPLSGLIREAYEELGINFSSNIFQLIGTALSRTPSDGLYGLFIYHTFVEDSLNIKINPAEHSAYLWVTIAEFQSLNLLTAQREAFKLVEQKLKLFIGECYHD